MNGLHDEMQTVLVNIPFVDIEALVDSAIHMEGKINQANENRKTDADIDKRNAETDHLVARGRVAQAQAGLKEAETAVKQQEARDLPQKQAQEAEVRKARAAQARAAAQRIKSQMKVKVKQKKY